MKSLEDEALLRLIVQKKSEALSELYDRYSRLVFSLALHIVGDQETAEEITQDVFFRVWEKAGSYQSGKAKVSTWLTSITRYRSIDDLRRRGVRPEANSIDWDSLAEWGIPATSTNNPEEITDQSLVSQQLINALKQLPIEQKTALALAYFQGLTHNEIAEVLGDPLGTVKTRIRLGMQKLRDLLQEDLILWK